MSSLRLHCDCHSVEFSLTGDPLVRAYCHCASCRNLHQAPVVLVTAWQEDQFALQSDPENLGSYAYPGKTMERFWCKQCGCVLFNTNRFDYYVVPQGLIRKHVDASQIDRWSPQLHLFYDERVMDVDDELTKHQAGFDSPEWVSDEPNTNH